MHKGSAARCIYRQSALRSIFQRLFTFAVPGPGRWLCYENKLVAGTMGIATPTCLLAAYVNILIVVIVLLLCWWGVWFGMAGCRCVEMSWLRCRL